MTQPQTPSQTKQYMLLFTIGPVQSFIAQARKTRDLWLGSYLLSVLMEAAMDGMDDVLVFPTNPHIEGKIPDLPNRYIAIFDKQEKAKKAAEDSEGRIVRAWKSICDEVWDKIVYHAPGRTKETSTIWDRQINPKRFFEVFWVVVEGDRERYAQWLTETQLDLAARKRLRHIQWENPIDKDHKDEPEKGEKSTISGEREALRGDGLYREEVRKFWQELIARDELFSLDINPVGEERLDAIDTVKRFAYRTSIIKRKLRTENDEHKGAGFPSTSSIATASFVEQILRKGDEVSRKFLQEWLNATKDNSLAITPAESIPYLYTIAEENGLTDALVRDGDCFFYETFVPTRLEKDYSIPKEKGDDKRYSSTVASKGQEGLRTLLKGTDALGITRPSSYYAMIQMDGDKMGTLLGKVSGKDEHKGISSALSTFSRQTAKTLVEDQYPGRLIYAGGDDVFALAPLARDITDEIEKENEPLTVLELANRLQQQYHDIVSDAVEGDDRKDTVTASTGIAIAHHYTSLSYVRRVSKEAESQAKKTYGRNSLVVTLLRRSGEQTRVGCRWVYNGYTMKRKGTTEEVPLCPVEIFSEFYRLFKEDKLSPKCVYLLLEEASALVHPALFLDSESETANYLLAMQTSEIKRVLRRQRSSNDADNGITDDETIRLAENLVNLAKAMDKDARKSIDNQEQFELQEKTRAVDLHSEDRRYGLVEVLGWLQVMVFLTRKEQD